MKSSNYNILFPHKTSFFVFNQLSGALMELDEALYCALENDSIDIIDKVVSDKLFKAGILCNDNLEESQIIVSRNRIQRYGNKIVRLTVMPTIDCNFRCWYCYENHEVSKMTETIAESIVLFAQKLIKENKLSYFHLDWFGGEPLLHFYDIIYPLSKKIKKICENNHVDFINSITTNGYLINPDMISLLDEIELYTYQITLDGEKNLHNRTRFTFEDRNTYDKIVENIELLCTQLNKIDITVRINYTVQNIKTIDKIADSFNSKIRGKIMISPHVVWQHSERIVDWVDKIEAKMAVFNQKGYMVKEYVSNPKNCMGCYIENMLQFVINYDAKVYKCTARNFDEIHCVGNISIDGQFVPTPLFYKYYSTNSAIERKECLKCKYLPSCNISCIQKLMEGSRFVCRKEEVKKMLLRKLEKILASNEM